MIDLSYIDNKYKITDLPLDGKKVLVRVDFNVPLSEDRLKILDDSRILAVVPTIQYLLEKKAKVILLTHFKRPKEWEESKSLRPLVQKIEDILQQKVTFLTEKIGSADLQEAVNKIPYGKVILLENIRFYKEETQNDTQFAKKIASLGDIFINDAFGTMHRAHSSTVGIAQFLPSAIGFLPVKEIEYIRELLYNAKKPVTVILGGGKISSKITLLKGLMSFADNILIGGAMAFTFLKAQGVTIGKSLCEDDFIPEVENILKTAKNNNVNLYFPLDILCASELKENTDSLMVNIGDGIPENMMGLDIGDATIDFYKSILETSKTIFWNGPLGVFEVKPFDKGTKQIALYLQKLSRENSDLLTMIGGGESALASRLYKVDKDISYISTGGGALLELLEGKTLPGILAISSKKN